MVPEAGGMRSPVLRHRLLVSYVPLQTESSGNVLRRHHASGTTYRETLMDALAQPIEEWHVS